MSDYDVRRQWKNESQISLVTIYIPATRIPSSLLLHNQPSLDATISTQLIPSKSSCRLECKETSTACRLSHNLNLGSICQYFSDNPRLFVSEYGCGVERRVGVKRGTEVGQDDICSIISRCYSSVDQGHSDGKTPSSVEQTTPITLSFWSTESYITSISNLETLNSRMSTSQAHTSSWNSAIDVTSHSLALTPIQSSSIITNSIVLFTAVNPTSSTLSSTLIASTSCTTLTTPSPTTPQPNPSTSPLWDTISPAAKILILLSSIIFFILLLLASLLLWHRRHSRQRPLSTSSTLSFLDIGIPVMEFHATTPPDSDGICWPEEAVLTDEAREMREWTREYEMESGNVAGRRKMLLGGELVKGKDGRWVREEI